MTIHDKSVRGAPLLMMLAIAALVTGCGGGSVTPAPMQNAAPTLSPLTAQTVNQDTSTAAQPFTVSDDGGTDTLTFAVTSTDANLLPDRGLVLGGSGGNRTVTVTPGEDATGTANVTVTATDSGGKFASATFPVTVQAVSQSILGYTNSTFALMENDTPAAVSGFTFVQDADDATFAPLLQ
jgi:hypothetical protein